MGPRMSRDVTGAGDTVIAMMAGGLSAGLPMADAARYANHAAGVVVAKLGTASVTPEELEHAISDRDLDSFDRRLSEDARMGDTLYHQHYFRSGV